MKRLASMDCLFPLAGMLNGFSSTWPSQSSRSMWPGGDGRGRIHEDRQGEDRCPGDPALIALRVLFQQCSESACCIVFSC